MSWYAPHNPMLLAIFANHTIAANQTLQTHFFALFHVMVIQLPHRQRHLTPSTFDCTRKTQLLVFCKLRAQHDLSAYATLRRMRTFFAIVVRPLVQGTAPRTSVFMVGTIYLLATQLQLQDQIANRFRREASAKGTLTVASSSQRTVHTVIASTHRTVMATKGWNVCRLPTNTAGIFRWMLLKKFDGKTTVTPKATAAPRISHGAETRKCSRRCSPPTPLEKCVPQQILMICFHWNTLVPTACELGLWHPPPLRHRR